MKQQQPAYISSLTPLRGIAALWVVAFHVDAILGFAGYPHLLPHETTGLLSRGYLWVDFFFILSGFIICHVYGPRFTSGISRRQLRAYVVARLSRIYPLHLFSLVGVAAVYGFIVAFVPERLIPSVFSVVHAPEALPHHLLLTHSMGVLDGLTWNFPSWSISVEWWTYLVALPLFPLVNRGHQPRTWVSIAAALAALFVLVRFTTKGTLDTTYDLGFFRCFLEFTVGIGIYQLFKTRTAAWLGTDVAFASASAVIIALLHSTLPDVLVVPAFSLLILAAAYNKAHARDLLSARPLRWLGDVSYSIYLMQGIWLIPMWVALEATQDGIFPISVSPSVAFLLLLVVVACTVLTAALTYTHVEVAGRNWLRGRLVTSTNPQETPPNNSASGYEASARRAVPEPTDPSLAPAESHESR